MHNKTGAVPFRKQCRFSIKNHTCLKPEGIGSMLRTKINVNLGVSRDSRMTVWVDARRALDWDAQWTCALDPQTAKSIRADRSSEHEDTCSMCGKFCAVRSMNKALNNELVDIL